MEKANLLQDILETAGYECSQYSGRGMLGKTCLSVDPGPDIGEFFADVVEQLKECSLTYEDSDGKRDEFEAVQEGFRNMRQDSMGRGAVVYFPNVRYVGEGEEDDDHVEGDCADPSCCTPGA